VVSVIIGTETVIKDTKLKEHVLELIYLVRPPGKTTPPRGLGFADLFHEETDDVVLKLVLECIQARCIDCLLFQQVPSVNHPIRKTCL